MDLNYKYKKFNHGEAISIGMITEAKISNFLGFLSSSELERIIKHFKKFKIDKKLLSFAKKDCIFLHCLPRGKEVDEEIFSSSKSKVWQQAQNLSLIHI